VTQPGGFPLYKNNRMVGGVGVFGSSPDVNEFASFAGTTGFQLAAPDPGKIYLEGIILPFQRFFGNRPAGTATGDFPAGGVFRALPNFVGQAVGAIAGGTRASPIVALPFAPEGYLIGPVAGTAITQAEVDSIIQAAVAQANRTRAAIRLPPGQRCKMIIAVAEGIGSAAISKGALLALFRMSDATIFSADVAATKAKNVVYFSDPNRFPDDLPGVPPGIAVSARTIGFGAQSMFPSGIKVSSPGPFRDLFLFSAANPCAQGRDPADVFPDANESGIVFFPGSTSLYKNGVMVAGLGASGDGVAQDDVITEFGGRGFLPSENMRADTVIIAGVRLPYFKFNRNPEQ
jgi:uncharacterized protein GlcG (DUF336 family)